MIAGEGIVGILLALFAVLNWDVDLSSIYGDKFMSVGNWVGLVVFALLIASLFFFSRKGSTVEMDAEDVK